MLQPCMNSSLHAFNENTHTNQQNCCKVHGKNVYTDAVTAGLNYTHVIKEKPFASNKLLLHIQDLNDLSISVSGGEGLRWCLALLEMAHLTHRSLFQSSQNESSYTHKHFSQQNIYLHKYSTHTHTHAAFLCLPSPPQ